MIKEIILPFSRARARIVNSNDYFLLKSRQDWRERFIDYLEAPNHEYPMEVIDWMNSFEITQYLLQFNCSCIIIKKN